MTEATDHDHLFCDEAGDPNLFNKRGVVIVGTPGVSNYFMLGVVHLPQPQLAETLLYDLRAALLADPYFAGVPSMQSAQGKTALGFHAKDDLPEVRREVLKILPRLNATVQIAVRRKLDLAAEARELHLRGYRLTADMIYDDLVNRLFLGLLSPRRNATIAFARRGKADRLQALGRALDHAIETIPSDAGPSTIAIYADQPQQNPGLQVADYYLWLVQRLFERAEDRFFNLVRGDYRVVMDLDDRRRHPAGEWYDENNRLSIEKIKPAGG